MPTRGLGAVRCVGKVFPTYCKSVPTLNGERALFIEGEIFLSRLRGQSQATGDRRGPVAAAVGAGVGCPAAEAGDLEVVLVDRRAGRHIDVFAKIHP